jgi:hypothetical protein
MGGMELQYFRQVTTVTWRCPTFLCVNATCSWGPPRDEARRGDISAKAADAQSRRPATDIAIGPYPSTVIAPYPSKCCHPRQRCDVRTISGSPRLPDVVDPGVLFPRLACPGLDQVKVGLPPTSDTKALSAGSRRYPSVGKWSGRTSNRMDRACPGVRSIEPAEPHSLRPTWVNLWTANRHLDVEFAP